MKTVVQVFLTGALGLWNEIWEWDRTWNDAKKTFFWTGLFSSTFKVCSFSVKSSILNYFTEKLNQNGTRWEKFYFTKFDTWSNLRNSKVKTLRLCVCNVDENVAMIMELITMMMTTMMMMMNTDEWFTVWRPGQDDFHSVNNNHYMISEKYPAVCVCSSASHQVMSHLYK